MRSTSPKRKQSSSRYAQIEARVLELLGKIDPNGYSEIAKDLRARLRPKGSDEAVLVDHMAAISWRIRGCWALETEILKEGVAALAAENNPTTALARAFVHDLQGPNLLTKLSSYETMLDRVLEHNRQAMDRLVALRQRQTNRASQKLAKLPPITPVIQ